MKIHIQLCGEIKGFAVRLPLIRRIYFIQARWGGQRRPYMQAWLEGRTAGAMNDLSDGKPGLRLLGEILWEIVQSELRLGRFNPNYCSSFKVTEAQRQTFIAAMNRMATEAGERK